MKPIKVWRFAYAPARYRTLSAHGGDEDWLAAVPIEQAGDSIPWLEGGAPFGVCSVSEHPVPREGVTIFIGAHA